MIADIKAPDSKIARDAEELARTVSNDMLFNHVMRCYWFGEFFARKQGVKVDSELMFLSSVLHDLGLTPQKFLVGNGVPADRAQKVWDNIALHTWDINLFRDDTSRMMELGVLYDVLGVPDAGLDANDVVKLVRRYPRLKFKTAFNDTLNRELDAKQPYPHVFHICSTIAHNRAPLRMPDAPTVLNMAPFDE